MHYDRLLRCPQTHEPLARVGDRLCASGCSYEIRNGIPILLSGDRTVFSELATPASVSGKRRMLRRMFPTTLSPTVGVEARFRRFLSAVREGAKGRATILVIGGGQLGHGVGELVDLPDVDLVETDVYIGPRTMIVCDGHALPFADASFDGVVIQAVLEHVLDPPAVVAEIHRVLKPTGVVYAETPFMQQVHEGPYDFTRWTESGHRRLFRRFSTIETGIAAGPAASLLWSIAYFARAIPRRPVLQLAMEKFAGLCFIWLKPLDRWLLSRPGASDGASAVYFMGRWAQTPVSDFEVLARYGGTIGVPRRRR